ncbi:calcium-translocating P-type ATPase, PMCA-type [Christensenella timonensis]|uniref:calcium-translocating P-type ATPase, PMCA-type n=1 Tax=Christensenella timonensis TaxID=1816678 RepID=UPI000830F877|nr:calcium-translocating P-type ATPase, PMCA-type [Christensenella timonensis]
MQAFLEKGEQTARRLGTDTRQGLTSCQAEENAKKYGRNEFAREKPDSLLKRLKDAATEPMIIMLIAAGLIALAVNIARGISGGEADFLECVGIFVAISLSVVITVIMEGKSAKAFEALSEINQDVLVKAVRDGQVQLIPQKDIVVGDIIHLETGDKLPADGRLLVSKGLSADEASLTGESVPAEKDADAAFTDKKTPVAERSNMLYSGCFITGGSGVMVVTAVGDQTEFGKIAQELSDTQKASTPLQEKLAKLGKTITILGAAAAAVVFAIQVIIFLTNGTASLDTVSSAFITSIVLIVAAVPEGLPTIVAVSLALNIIKMAKQNALVKKMVACETVGCVSIICSDKTGTLTQNRMTVLAVGTKEGVVRPEELTDGAILRNFCINGTADLSCSASADFIGNPTECALLVAAQKAGQDYRQMRAAKEIACVFPFSSETKNMTTIVLEEGRHIAYTKGSPEKVLAMCALDEARRRQAEADMLSYQEKSCRVIAFAHKGLADMKDYESGRQEIESGMVYDGFAAIADPLREDVFAAVGRCRSAGIDLKILTGDNLVTATAIAGELDLLGDGHIAVEANMLEGLSDEQLLKALPKIRVIARSTPGLKMRVVNALKANGDVVAVTGDGINDAPALKNADVGIAMGISGTEVSKEASDIVLLDDSFSTIVKAVQWGRGIYENFQRFIQFQLTVNLSSVVVVLCSILMGFVSPFSALQLLWINIIMDGPPALTLGLEPIREDLMKRTPIARDKSIVTKGMLGRIAFNGIFISAVFMAQHTWNFLGAAPQQTATVLFTLFVVFQLFNAFNSRELSDVSMFKNIGNNKLMLLVFLVTFALQVVITQFGGAFFGTVPLQLEMWMRIILCALSVIAASELFKLAKRALLKAKRIA